MKLSTFQFAVLAFFILFTIAGVVAFAVFGRGANNTSVGPVTIWGTVDGQTMDTLITTLSSQNKIFQNVTYVQLDPTTYSATLINALASGNSPDLFLVTQDTVSSFANKLSPIPYNAVSQASYLSSFIDEGQLFLTPQGSLALPFMIDPLVMYWNRDLFASAGIAQPPSHWSDFLSLTPKITSIDAQSNVARSAVALGEWQNITDAKMILSALFMQAGDPIVTRAQNGALQSVFGATPSGAVSNPAASVLLFYTEFANPSKTTYSWNRSLPQSRNDFAAGNLAVYFGLASDDPVLTQSNPNLSFGVAELPQIQNNPTQLTFGELTGIAISRIAGNPQGALAVAEALSAPAAQQQLAAETNLPSVRRSPLTDTSGNATETVFAQSALIAHGWLDPDPASTDLLFQGMIESILSGNQEPAGAASAASQQMAQLVNPQQ